MAQLTKLPTELIEQIFSYLHYMTLNLQIRKVCRLFDKIITSSTSGPLGEALFRSTHKADIPYSIPSMSIPMHCSAGIEEEDMIHDKGYYFQLHPIIPFLALPHMMVDTSSAPTSYDIRPITTLTSSFQDVVIVTSTSQRQTPLHLTNMADEQALSRPIPPKLFYDLNSNFRSRDWFTEMPHIFLRTSHSSNKNITVRQFITLLLRGYMPHIAGRFRILDPQGNMLRMSFLLRGLDVSLAIMWMRKGIESRRREYRYSITTVLSDFEQQSMHDTGGMVDKVSEDVENEGEEKEKSKEERSPKEIEKIYTIWYIQQD